MKFKNGVKNDKGKNGWVKMGKKTELEKLKEIFIVPVNRDDEWIKRELEELVNKGVKVALPEREVIFTKPYTHKKEMLKARALSLLSVMEERDSK